MRPDGNPLDLNNLPDENSRDHGKQLPHTTSSQAVTGYNEKESGEDDRKDECGKVYECRFCSLKFCKSQALGGHMNRHRQEKETEKLNNARQLLLRNDHNLVAQAALHLGCYPPIATQGYHPTGNMGDHPPTLPLRFPRSSFSAGSSSSSIQQQPSQVQQYLYASPSRPMSFPPHMIPMNQMHDYRVNHHVMSNSHNNMNYVAGAAGGSGESSYTCIGAPIEQGFQDHPSTMNNRFQDSL